MNIQSFTHTDCEQKHMQYASKIQVVTQRTVQRKYPAAGRHQTCADMAEHANPTQTGPSSDPGIEPGTSFL